MPKDPFDFVCQKCGNCCRGEGYVYLSLQEIQRICQFLQMDITAFQRKYLEKHQRTMVLASHPNGDCIFLEDNLCKIHPVKPDQCRKWPFWPELIFNSQLFMEAKSYCEGLKEFEYEDFAQLKNTDWADEKIEQWMLTNLEPLAE
ncbi:MAG: YkgJ family cysteine cluster protein [Planctomycetota bacterium]|nr:MAG: YkgJ family cysteine cluster protein [Planctomycetota bacterium]